jgi:hypothetical protein
LRPPCVVPPAPRAPVGFSNVTARQSSEGSTKAGSQTLPSAQLLFSFGVRVIA